MEEQQNVNELPKFIEVKMMSSKDKESTILLPIDEVVVPLWKELSFEGKLER